MVSYSMQHKLIRAARGKARDQVCIHCGGQAAQWSKIRGTDGTDVWAHYRPMCRSCHMQYDLGGRTNSPEATQKQVATRKARGSYPGFEHTQESRAKISKALRGRIVSEETSKRISAAVQGKPKPHGPISEEQKAKISAANRGRIHSPESRKNMSEAHKGKPWSVARRDAYERNKQNENR